MKTYLCCEAGFVESPVWKPNCWINIECPTPEDLAYLTQVLKVPVSFLNDIADIDERPRIEWEDEWQLTIIRVPLRHGEDGIPFITIPLGIISKGEIFVTVCHYKSEMLPDFIKHSHRKQFKINNNYELTLRLLLSSSVWFLKYLKQLNNEVKDAEKELEKSIRNQELHRLMKIEKSMVFFNTSIRGNEVMLSKLHNIIKQQHQINYELIEDVETELKQAHIMANVYSDILTGTMDAFASIISNNVNTIMKRMTSISIILMIPTLIASFYGMNVPSGFEDAQWGFLFIVVLSFTLSAIGFFLFKKIKWF